MKMISNRPEKRFANGISHSQPGRKSDGVRNKRTKSKVPFYNMHTKNTFGICKPFISLMKKSSLV